MWEPLRAAIDLAEHSASAIAGEAGSHNTAGTLRGDPLPWWEPLQAAINPASTAASAIAG